MKVKKLGTGSYGIIVDGEQVATIESRWSVGHDSRGPDRAVCPWGERGTADCAEFGPRNCDGRRCGVPA